MTSPATTATTTTHPASGAARRSTRSSQRKAASSSAKIAPRQNWCALSCCITGNEVERRERDRGDERVAERAATARDEREQRGERDEDRAAEDDDVTDPRVDAVVRDADVGDGAETLVDPGGELVPGGRGEEAGGNARREEDDDQQRDGHDGGGQRARRPPETAPCDADERRGAGERREQGAGHRAARTRLDHGAPRARAERGKHEERGNARERDGQARLGRPPAAIDADAFGPRRGGHAGPRTGARCSVRGRRAPTT